MKISFKSLIERGFHEISQSISLYKTNTYMSSSLWVRNVETNKQRREKLVFFVKSVIHVGNVVYCNTNRMYLNYRYYSSYPAELS